MTPEKFAKRMAEIAKIQDIERRHEEANALLCLALSELGYAKGLEVFKRIKRWYA